MPLEHCASTARDILTLFRLCTIWNVMPLPQLLTGLTANHRQVDYDVCNRVNSDFSDRQLHRRHALSTEFEIG